MSNKANHAYAVYSLRIYVFVIKPCKVIRNKKPAIDSGFIFKIVILLITIMLRFERTFFADTEVRRLCFCQFIQHHTNLSKV